MAEELLAMADLFLLTEAPTLRDLHAQIDRAQS
jgi:hypothetical protein